MTDGGWGAVILGGSLWGGVLRGEGASAEGFGRALSSLSRSDGEVDPSSCEETEGATPW